MKKLLLLLAVLALAFAVSCKKASPAGPTVPSKDSNGYYSVSASGATFKWKIDGTNLDCELSAPTTGWVGVGFGPDGLMADAKGFVMGYVVSGTPTISEMYSVGHAAPQPDTVQNISNMTGTETGGTTEITFTLPMNSGDPQDEVFTQNMNLYILLAYGPNGADDFTTQHQAYGAVQTLLY
jgi:hypothetical protein